MQNANANTSKLTAFINTINGKEGTGYDSLGVFMLSVFRQTISICLIAAVVQESLYNAMHTCVQRVTTAF